MTCKVPVPKILKIPLHTGVNSVDIHIFLAFRLIQQISHKKRHIKYSIRGVKKGEVSRVPLSLHGICCIALSTHLRG